jgi:hypothetical protein
MLLLALLVALPTVASDDWTITLRDGSTHQGTFCASSRACTFCRSTMCLWSCPMLCYDRRVISSPEETAIVCSERCGGQVPPAHCGRRFGER